jgi:hypothetical protein
MTLPHQYRLPPTASKTLAGRGKRGILIKLTQIKYFGFLTRLLSRFILNGEYEFCSSWRRRVHDGLARLDYAILQGRLLRNFASHAVFMATSPE